MGMNMQQLMKQAQKMQRQMTQAQEELANTEVIGAAGGGMVKVTANGQGAILGIQIDPEVIDPEDKEMLEDMVLAAIQDAVSQAAALSQEKMGRFTNGMNIPGLF